MKSNLTTKYEIEKVTGWKDKRFSFFAYPRKTEKKSHRTIGTLPFARQTNQRFAKVKEPNLAVSHNIIWNDYKITSFAK
jgi:hypothetical protein